MLAVSKSTYKRLEELNPDLKNAMRKYMADMGVSRMTLSHLRRGRSLSSKNIEIIQYMVHDLKLRTK